MELNEIIKPENLVYERPKLMNDNPMHYCPGCSHGVIHKLIAEVIADHRNLMNAIERCDLAAFEPLVERHLYGGIRRLGSKLTEEYADFFEPETVK